jgi:hypothetical protein
MLIPHVISWFFTESHFGERNPFERFENEMLMDLDDLLAGMPGEDIEKLKSKIQLRTDEIFESDLSWSQSIYSRENLRWSSFLAGYHLTMQEYTDRKDCLQRLETIVWNFCHIRHLKVWAFIAKLYIFCRKYLPKKSPIRRIQPTRILQKTYLPYNGRSNWIHGRDSFYENFFTAHSCPELIDVLTKVSDQWKRYVPTEYLAGRSTRPTPSNALGIPARTPDETGTAS